MIGIHSDVSLPGVPEDFFVSNKTLSFVYIL